ncbi:ABC transporter permease [Ensifer adhaerens]|uniref:ABC transporter permease n=1 Tax=Ensifer adhaerens TaxID=106592 RepID=UPI001C4E0B1E|nr:ABC transporter permease [Ensifer adhaerens]MBW0370812.1 ABC transporter permease [Ensifer adhaerens]UCM24270.1 ABC transporter permease [Ensifer adhaerens]
MTETNKTARTPRLLIVAATLIGVWLVLPLIVIVPISFSGEDSFRFPPRTWTLDRYFSLADPVWFNAFLNSCAIAFLVALLSALLGMFVAFGITRSKSIIVSGLRVAILAPQVVPVIVFGLGLYLVFLRWNITGTMLGFVIAHTVLAIPFVVVPVTAALETFDRSLERASASLGAGPVATFVQITFPLIRPAVLSGSFLAFLSSFDELVLALFMKSPSFYTLPVLLYRRMTDSIDPTVAAVATIELVIVATGVVFAMFLQSRNQNLAKASSGAA